MRATGISPAFLLSSLMVLAGCNSAPSAPVITGTQCTDPRPQVCTMEYAPVCASLSKGGTADYSSGCNACADDAVVSFETGPCGDDASM